MYKRQMHAQKLLCYVALAVSVVVFVYSLGLLTDLYDSLYMTMRNPNDLTQTNVSGSFIYYAMQSFNQQLLLASIAMILLSVLLFLTSTHVRRKYYIGNLAATVAWAAAAVGVSVWGHIQLAAYRAQYLQIDFAALKEHAEMWGTLYTESTFWFDIHYLVFGLVILTAVALVGNYIWKRSLMKQEDELLAASGVHV